jgi:hypothetical protein
MGVLWEAYPKKLILDVANDVTEIQAGCGPVRTSSLDTVISRCYQIALVALQ